MMCIEKKLLCDGVPQCQDRSDEVDCFNLGEGCVHRCDKKRCLSEPFICDGEADCDDGSDEADCGNAPLLVPVLECFRFVLSPPCSLRPGKGSCSSAEFQCRSGQCVSISMHCDGSSDCSDHSDEDGCISQVTCADNQRRCQDNQQCVLQEWLCDGENDCKDTSDEQVTLMSTLRNRVLPMHLHVCPVLTSCLCVELYRVCSAVWGVSVAVCVSDSVRSSELAL